MDFGCDEIKCINLIERADKRLSFSKMMKDDNISFSYFNAIKDTDNNSRGCFLSHAKIISDAYKKGVQRLLVFEDDACSIKKITSDEIAEIRRFLDNEDWEIFLLGSYPNIWNYTIKKIPKYNKIYKGHFLASGAYILNRKGIEKYKDLKWGGKTKVIDKDVFMKNKKSYGRLPRVYMQRLIPNDIAYGNSKKTSTFVKGKALLNRIVIWYAQNINIELLKLIAIVFLVSIIILIIRKNRKI